MTLVPLRHSDSGNKSGDLATDSPIYSEAFRKENVRENLSTSTFFGKWRRARRPKV